MRKAVHPEPDLRLPRSYWKAFARDAWNQKPTLLRNPFSGGFPTTDELYEGLLAAAHAYRHGDPAEEQSFRVTLEHPTDPRREYAGALSSIVALPHPYLPTEKDGSLQNYVARLEESFAGFRFGVIFNASLRHSWNHWLQMKSFVEGLVPVLGMPLSGADSAVFIGNYRYTPFGIHKDEYHVFNFVVQGEKRMCLWPLEEFADRPEIPKLPNLTDLDANAVMTVDEQDAALERAEVLVGQPGDIQYWPPSYWHIAAPSEGVNVSISLGIAFRPPNIIPGIQEDASPGRLSARELPDHRSGASWSVPQKIRASRPSTAVLEGWLKLITGGGFNRAPALFDHPAFGRDEPIHAVPRRPIVLAAVGSGAVVVACNGHACSMTVTPRLRRTLRKLVAHLNAGDPVTVRELESGFAGPETGLKKRNLHVLLENLGRWRALVRNP